MKIKSCSYNKGICNIAPSLKKLDAIHSISVENSDRVYVSTKNMKGVIPSVVANVGDKVKVGTRIAVSGNDIICSPVSGVVEKVIKQPSVYGGNYDTVVIKNDNSETKENFTKVSLFESTAKLDVAIKTLSIVDYDGETIVNKIESVKNAQTRTLVVNLVTDEPYQFNTPFLINEKMEDCAIGIELMARVMDTSNVIIAIKKEDKVLYQDFVKLLEEKSLDMNFILALVPNRYPIGDEVELVGAITKKYFKNKHAVRDAGFVAFDIFSIFMAKRLVIDGEFQDSRPLTIIEKEGVNIKSTCVWVKFGTRIRDLVSKIKLDGVNGYNKIVAGGFFRGISLGNFDSSLPYAVKSIILIQDTLDDEPIELPSITCGKCVDVCPRGLVPYEVEKAILNQDYTEAIKFGAGECTKCGCCSYVCPSKRYLTQRIYFAQQIIINKGLRNE